MVKLVMYKNPTSIIGKIICCWTNSIYYHCEILFSDNITFSSSFSPWGTSFANFVEDINGQDIYNLDISKKEEIIIRQFCESENNCWYDIIGLIFCCIFKIPIQSKYWWFCSELVVAILHKIKILLNVVPYETTPGSLFNELLKTRNISLNNEHNYNNIQ